MTQGVVCFLLTPLEPGRAVRTLRRYSRGYDLGACPSAPGYGYHNADIAICEEDYPLADEANGWGREPDDLEKPDARWPTRCACGYAFLPGDHWQINVDRLYARSDGGPPLTLNAARSVPGAMYDARWLHHIDGFVPGPDGMVLTVITPGRGEWVIDGPSTNGRGWTRTGTAPKITATPSILIGDPARGIPERYQGWLRDGVLVLHSCFENSY